MTTSTSTAAANGASEQNSDDDALSVLLDADIDKVMAGLDRIVEAAPSYEKLFMRWQRQQWTTEDFDLSVDRRQWDSGEISGEEREFIRWGLSGFFLGEERVTTELLPFAIAAPSHEARAFLTTQISDEAKHMVFFDRFYREVFDETPETLTANLATARLEVHDDYEKLFDGILHEAAETLREDPSDFAALVRGVTVYMVVIEGTLDAIKADPANAKVVEATLKETLPTAVYAFVPPGTENPYDFQTPFYHSSEIFSYAMKALSKKLAAMGLDPALLTAAGV